MYYIGTLSQVNYYINKVNQGELYNGTTSTWATPLQSLEDDNKYAVTKHDKYEHSTMQLVETLPSEFISNAI